MKYFVHFFFLFIGFWFSGNNEAKSQSPSDKLKAVFIYNFTKNVTWTNINEIDTFRIAVFDKRNIDLFNELKVKLVGKNSFGKPLAVRLISALSELKEVQLVYANSDDVDQQRIFRKVKGNNTLLVGENFGDFNRSMINFVTDEGKIRYSLNTKVLNEEGFGLSESLRSNAIVDENGWTDLYSKYREKLKTSKNKITVSKEELEEMIETHEEQSKKIAEKELQNEKSLEEIEKLGLEAQAKELKIRAQNDEIRRNKLEAENKKQENELLRREALLQDSEARAQKNITLLVSIALVIILIISIFIVRSWYKTRRQNEIIEAQKNRVEQQNMIILASKQLIEEKNKDITDSITYALRIQNAKLPPLTQIERAFPKYFVLFKPKDIVSGDFYYFKESDQSNFIAVGDCTGHGVPGAFMSLISMEKLDEALQHTSDPAEILQRLNRSVKSSLNQNEDEQTTRDGMDIAICRWIPESRRLIYSGANRSLWVLRKGELEIDEVKATKKAIGGFTSDNQIYESHSLHLEKGDTFYIFSDGYADTFNGGNGKKLTTRKFKEILLSIRDMDMKEQGMYLSSFIEEWKAGTEQIDDICVTGIRV